MNICVRRRILWLDKRKTLDYLSLTRKSSCASISCSNFCGLHKKQCQKVEKKWKSGRKKEKIHKHKISIQTFLSCHSSYSFLPRKKSIKPRASSPKLNVYSINHFIQGIAASPSPFRCNNVLARLVENVANSSRPARNKWLLITLNFNSIQLRVRSAFFWHNLSTISSQKVSSFYALRPLLNTRQTIKSAPPHKSSHENEE